MFNRTKHIYLYAKYHYKRTNDPVADVQTIIKNCGGQEFSRLDVIKIVFHIALKHLTDDTSDGSSDSKFESFILNVDPDGTWKVGYYHNKYHSGEFKDRVYDYWEAVFYASLSVIYMTNIADAERLSDFNFGDGNATEKVFELSESTIY